MDAAASAFARYGFADTSIDKIAELLGATKGRVYHYYRAKANIFTDIVISGMQEMIDVAGPIAARSDLSPFDRLWRMSRHHASLMMTRNSFQRVAVAAVEMNRLHDGSTGTPATSRRIVALRDTYEQLFADVIDDGRREGVFRDVDARMATKPVLGALNWISIWYDPDRGETAALERIAEDYADFVVNGLRRLPR